MIAVNLDHVHFSLLQFLPDPHFPSFSISSFPFFSSWVSAVDPKQKDYAVRQGQVGVWNPHFLTAPWLALASGSTIWSRLRNRGRRGAVVGLQLPWIFPPYCWAGMAQWGNCLDAVLAQSLAFYFVYLIFYIFLNRWIFFICCLPRTISRSFMWLYFMCYSFHQFHCEVNLRNYFILFCSKFITWCLLF